MLAALCWWTYLLYCKNQVIHDQQVAIISLTNGNDTVALNEIKNELNRQNRMIISEGFVFGLALVAGITFLYAAYRKTLIFSQRQNNFLLSITHELKTPLASIKLAFETIKKRKLKPEQNADISSSGIVEVDRLHKQVENILTATSIDQSYEPQYQECSLSTILDELKNNRKLRPDEERVKYEIAGDSDELFKADVYGFYLICENLIGNALKYSEDDINVLLNKNKSKLSVIVSDTGIGIDESEQKNIFKRFYRVGNEETRRSKGTGLGLFLVHKIVDKNKGSIKIEKNQPKGSIFHIKMPTK